MPPLPNPRQEKFVQGLVKGLNQTEAYTEAGYEPNRSHASRMVTYGNIQERYAELFDATLPDVKWDRENVNKQYTELLLRLKKAEKLEAAARVVDSIAKVNGLIVTRHETGKAGEFDALSDYELLELIAEPLGDSRAETDEND